MPGLTVTEKEHWKDRIGKRIDKRIEGIYAEDPNLKERIERDARARALASLNLTDLDAEMNHIEAEEKRLEKRKEALHKEMLAKVRGTAIEDIDDGCGGYYPHRYEQEVDQAIERRRAVHADELLVEDQHGQRILQLRDERDNLLDTVWLATSPTQIRELWVKVSALLDEQPTQLERDALAIEPASDA